MRSTYEIAIIMPRLKPLESPLINYFWSKHVPELESRTILLRSW
jgi:hypothetical protein